LKHFENIIENEALGANAKISVYVTSSRKIGLWRKKKKYFTRRHAFCASSDQSLDFLSRNGICINHLSTILNISKIYEYEYMEKADIGNTVFYSRGRVYPYDVTYCLKQTCLSALFLNIEKHYKISTKYQFTGIGVQPNRNRK